VRRRPHDQLVIARGAQSPQQGVECIARHGELRAAGHPQRTRREDGRQLLGATPHGMLGELAQRLGLGRRRGAGRHGHGEGLRSDEALLHASTLTRGADTRFQSCEVRSHLTYQRSGDTAVTYLPSDRRAMDPNMCAIDAGAGKSAETS
jgi:hypothetical protein